MPNSAMVMIFSLPFSDEVSVNSGDERGDLHLCSELCIDEQHKSGDL